MTTSGTTNWFLSNGDIVLEAFDRIQVRPTSLDTDHLTSAYRSINLAFQSWANRGVNLWTIDLLTIPLVPGQASYALPADTVMIRDVYTSQNFTTTQPTNRLLYPLSRNDYAALPDPNNQGEVNSFWFNRQTPQPLMVLWLVPSATAPATNLAVYRNKQIQDANLINGETPNIPYRFLEACCTDLSARLAQKFNPASWPALRADAAMAWKEAADEDTERVSLYIAPSTEGYWQ